MNNKFLDKSYGDALSKMFRASFGDSEGEAEGELIGKLALELSVEIDGEHIISMGAFEDHELIGAIFFSRLYFEESVEVYMLAPAGVSTSYQGRGVGTKLIHWGISEILKRPVSFLITYGDPAYYTRFGFKQISEEVVKAPHKLSLPHGWLGFEVQGRKIPVLESKPKCVKQFNHQKLW